MTEPHADEMIDLSQLDVSMQSKALILAKSFSGWTRIRNVCSDEAIQANAKELSSRIQPRGKNTEDELLIYLFNEMVKNCTTQEKAQIIEFKRKLIPYKKQASDLVRARIENIVDIAIKIITNQWVRLAIGLIVVYYTWTLCLKVLAFAQHLAILKGLPLLINHAPLPVIKVVHVVLTIFKIIYHYPLSTFVGTFAISAFMSRICPPLNRWVFKPLVAITFKIGFFYVDLSLRMVMVFTYVENRSLVLGEKMNQLNRSWSDFRMGHEMIQAREKWIELYKAQRNEIRQELEQAYREQEALIARGEEDLMQSGAPLDV